MGKAEGKTVLITGGSRGLGRALADRFGRAGARIILWARTEKDLEDTVCQLEENECEAYWYSVDVTDSQRVQKAASEIKKRFGFVEVLINNAGFVSGGPFLEVPIEDHIKTMEINVNAYMRTIMVFLPEMVERNQGHIINIASAAGLSYVPLLSSYCASKAAVINLTDSLRLEMKYLGKDGVKFLIVCPAFVRTGMFEGVQTPPWLPWLEPDKMADKIFRAFEKDREYLAEPLFPKLAPVFRAFIPRKFLDYFQTELGLSKSMEEWKGHGD